MSDDDRRPFFIVSSCRSIIQFKRPSRLSVIARRQKTFTSSPIVPLSNPVLGRVLSFLNSLAAVVLSLSLLRRTAVANVFVISSLTNKFTVVDDYHSGCNFFVFHFLFLDRDFNEIKETRGRMPLTEKLASMQHLFFLCGRPPFPSFVSRGDQISTF